MSEIVLREGPRLLRFGFEELLRYHGGGFPGGVAHGFQVLRRALPLLAGGAPPERRAIRVETGFPGPGARDAFEAATRCVTDGRFRCDPALGAGAAPPAASGQYWFRLSHQEAVVTLALRLGFIDAEFLALSRKPVRDDAEEARMLALRQELADRLLRLAAEEVYDVE